MICENRVKVASTFMEEKLCGLPTKAKESTKLENRVLLAIKFFERFFVETNVFGQPSVKRPCEKDNFK